MQKKNRDTLPGEHDFSPFGDLDSQSAWKHFGRLTLVQANEKFRENPLYYQEDFMFMGGGAFAYYFPVIDRYIRDALDSIEYVSNELLILAHCIRFQFEVDDISKVRHIIGDVLSLSAFVISNIRRFGLDEVEAERVLVAWEELSTFLNQSL